MAENEKIGGVEIDITGNYSELAKDFAEAQELAKQAGEKIAAAMNTGAMAAADFDTEFKKLVDSGKSINEAMQILGQQFQDVGDNAKKAAGGIEEAATATEGLKQQVIQFKPVQDQVNDSLDQFAERALKAFTVYKAANFLKDMAVDAVQAYADLQKADIALTYLTGDSEKAAQAIAGLKDIAISEALSFPALVTAQQRFTEFDVAADKIPELLKAAGDAAAATDRSFDAVANAIERMVESGAVMSRSLVQVGLSTQDLANTMGVSAEEVKTAFKDLDPTERAQVFVEAMAKMKGIAEEAAQGISGQLQNISTEWTFTLQKIGSALAPATESFLSWAQQMVKGVGDLADQFARLRGEIDKTDTGKLANLALSLPNPFTLTKELLFGGGTQGSGEGQGQGSTLPGGKGDFGGEAGLPDSTANIESNTKAIVAHNQAVRDAAAAAEAMTNAYQSFDASVRPLWEKLPQDYASYLDKLTQGGATAASMLKTITADIDKASSVSEDMTGKRLEQMNQWVAALTGAQERIKSFADTDAFYKAAQQIQLLTDKFPEQVKELAASDEALKTFFQIMKDGAATVPDALNKLSIVDLTKQAVEAQKQLDDSTKKLGDTFEKSWAQFEKGTRKAVDTIHEFTYTIQQDEVSWDKAWQTVPKAIQSSYDEAIKFNAALKGLGIEADASGEAVTKHIAEFNDLAANSNTTLPILELGWAKVSSIISKLAKEDLPLAIDEYNRMLKAASGLSAPMGDQLRLQENLLKAEVDYATRRGEDATQQIIQLDGVNRAQQALIDQSQLLGKTYVGVMNDFDHAFQNLGKGIADNIVDAKNWGDVFMGILKTLEKEILETLIGSVFKQLSNELLKSNGLLSDLAKGLTGVSKEFGVGGGGGGGGASFLGKLFGSGGGGGGGFQVPGGPGSSQSQAVLNGTGTDADYAAVDQYNTGAAGPGEMVQPEGGGEGEGGGGGGAPLGGALPLISLGVQIAAGITAGIQASRMTSLLSGIEISTRKTQAQLIEGVQPSLNQYLPELDHLVDLWREAMRTNQLLTIIRDQGGPGGPPPQYPPPDQEKDYPVTSHDLVTNDRGGSNTFLRGGANARLPIYNRGGVAIGWQVSDIQPIGDINSLGAAGARQILPEDYNRALPVPLTPTYPSGTGMLPAGTKSPGITGFDFDSQLAQFLAKGTQYPGLPSTAQSPAFNYSGGPNGTVQTGSNVINVYAVDPTGRSIVNGLTNALNERGYRTN